MERGVNGDFQMHKMFSLPLEHFSYNYFHSAYSIIPNLINVNAKDIYVKAYNAETLPIDVNV